MAEWLRLDLMTGDCLAREALGGLVRFLRNIPVLMKKTNKLKFCMT
jgi:hypothetical protein